MEVVVVMLTLLLLLLDLKKKTTTPNVASISAWVIASLYVTLFIAKALPFCLSCHRWTKMKLKPLAYVS
jgi:hypothetical protein